MTIMSKFNILGQTSIIWFIYLSLKTFLMFIKYSSLHYATYIFSNTKFKTKPSVFFSVYHVTLRHSIFPLVTVKKHPPEVFCKNRRFPVDLVNFLRTPFLQNTSGPLLLTIILLLRHLKSKKVSSQPSKLTIETLQQGVKYFQS